MAVKLVITYEVIEARHPDVCYAFARSIDEALPTFLEMISDPTMAKAFKYYIGLLEEGEVVTERMYFGSGQHYIIVGSSAHADEGDYHKLKVTIATETGQKIKEVVTDKINNETYFVIGFGVNADDPGIDGIISPNETPGITTGETEKTTAGWPIDPKMFEDMMNFMVQMMMFMAMMQVMMGMIQSIPAMMAGAT